MKRLLGPIGGKPNPMLFLAPLNGSLAFQDRAGGGTLTGSGAVRYAPASGARTNAIKNPRFASATTSWTGVGTGTTISRTADGDFIGGYCCEVVTGALNAYGIGQSGAVTDLYGVQVTPGVAVVFSFYAKSISGLTSFNIEWTERTASGTSLASGNSSFTMTETVARYQFTRAPGSAGTHYITFRVVQSGAGAATFRVSNFQLEAGSTATDYFDGSTGGVWLDPITGILGTAHASPSVSQAVAWVEEGTTNLIPNPSAEVDVSGWNARGAATRSRVTTHAKYGSACFQVATSGGSSGMEQVTGVTAATTGETVTLSFWVRNVSGSGQMRAAIAERDTGIGYLRQTLTGSLTPTDEWVRHTLTATMGADTDTIYIVFERVGATDFTFALDGIQVEKKATATSYCDGSIGTGYAWSGTAHASSSTRTTTALGGALVTSARINTVRGSVALRALRRYDIGANHVVFSTGNVGVSNTDAHAINIYGTDDKIGAQWSTNSAAAQITRWGSADTPDTWSFVVADWNGTDQGITLNAGTRVAGSRAAPAGTPDTSGGLGIGDYTGGLGNNLNGYIGPVLIADRPLTAKERANLHARTSWAWGRL